METEGLNSGGTKEAEKSLSESRINVQVQVWEEPQPLCPKEQVANNKGSVDK